MLTHRPHAGTPRGTLEPGDPLQTAAAAPGDDGRRMAARRGTSRDRRVPRGALPWAPAGSTRDPTPRPLDARRRCTLAPALAASLVACQPPADAGPHRDLPDSSTGPADGDTTAAGDSSGPDVLDTGPQQPSYPAPDCTTLIVPGPPSDLAATPRPDRDAEVLALSLDPTRVAAPQASYDVVTADLAAIRALDPTLAEVHVGCVFPNGIAFWLFDALDVNDALFAGNYHAWDCHNQFFHVRQERRVDGLAVALELDGVFGEAMNEAYASLPGLDDQGAWWFSRDDWPHIDAYGPDCASTAGSITLTATLLPDGALDQRDYHFARPDGSSVGYRVTPREPPQILR